MYFRSSDLHDGRRDELSLTTENKGGTVELIVKSTANEGIIRILLEYNKKEKRRWSDILCKSSQEVEHATCGPKRE